MIKKINLQKQSTQCPRNLQLLPLNPLNPAIICLKIPRTVPEFHLIHIKAQVRHLCTISNYWLRAYRRTHIVVSLPNGARGRVPNATTLPAAGSCPTTLTR